MEPNIKNLESNIAAEGYLETKTVPKVVHPLDPLSPDEVRDTSLYVFRLRLTL